MKNDYYPFGMLVPNRHGSSNSYRYGFNGKEKDDEVKGEGVQYDYGFRIYDARIARFLSMDPLLENFQSVSVSISAILIHSVLLMRVSRK